LNHFIWTIFKGFRAQSLTGYGEKLLARKKPENSTLPLFNFDDTNDVLMQHEVICGVNSYA